MCAAVSRRVRPQSEGGVRQEFASHTHTPLKYIPPRQTSRGADFGQLAGPYALISRQGIDGSREDCCITGRDSRARTRFDDKILSVFPATDSPPGHNSRSPVPRVPSPEQGPSTNPEPQSETLQRLRDEATSAGRSGRPRAERPGPEGGLSHRAPPARQPAPRTPHPPGPPHSPTSVLPLPKRLVGFHSKRPLQFAQAVTRSLTHVYNSCSSQPGAQHHTVDSKCPPWLVKSTSERSSFCCA